MVPLSPIDLLGRGCCKGDIMLTFPENTPSCLFCATVPINIAFSGFDLDTNNFNSTYLLLGSFISKQQQQAKFTKWSNTASFQFIHNSTDTTILDAAKFYAKGILLHLLFQNTQKNVSIFTIR